MWRCLLALVTVTVWATPALVGAGERQRSNEVTNAAADEKPTKSLGWQQGRLAYTRVDLSNAVAQADVIVLGETTAVEGRHTDALLAVKPKLVLKGVLKEGTEVWANFLGPVDGVPHLLFIKKYGEEFHVDAIFTNATDRQIAAVRRMLATKK